MAAAADLRWPQEEEDAERVWSLGCLQQSPNHLPYRDFMGAVSTV
jgi:hypothetical protein